VAAWSPLSPLPVTVWPHHLALLYASAGFVLLVGGVVCMFRRRLADSRFGLGRELQTSAPAAPAGSLPPLERQHGLTQVRA